MSNSLLITTALLLYFGVPAYRYVGAPQADAVVVAVAPISHGLLCRAGRYEVEVSTPAGVGSTTLCKTAPPARGERLAVRYRAGEAGQANVFEESAMLSRANVGIIVVLPIFLTACWQPRRRATHASLARSARRRRQG